MKPDDFLKVEKVKCLDDTGVYLTENKEYQLLGVTDKYCIINDDCSCKLWARIGRFEPVPNQAENPLQNIELTPEFEAVEPKFQVGDKVYVGLTGKIARVTKIIDDDVVNVANKNNEVRAWISNICHATPENYERLQATFPDIKFEQPPKPLTGSDLCLAIKAKGKKFIICAVSDISEEDAINNYLNSDEEMDVIFEIDDELDHPFIAIWGNLYKFAVPLSEETGEPLTESILND